MIESGLTAIVIRLGSRRVALASLGETLARGGLLGRVVKVLNGASPEREPISADPAQ
jgi:hypothetical protein